ncbi:MAG: YIP1 family protein [Pseudomonadota bacterium]
MNGLVSLIGSSVTKPSQAASDLLGLGLNRSVAWMMLALSVIVTVIFSFGISGGDAVELVPGMNPFSPLMTTVFLGCSAVVMAYAVYFTGNAMDGAGTLTGSILVVAWLQILQLVGLVLQGAVFFVSPGFGSLVGIVIGFGLIWVLLSFIDVLHGFGSLGRSSLLLLFVVVGIGLGLTLILGLIGVGL